MEAIDPHDKNIQRGFATAVVDNMVEHFNMSKEEAQAQYDNSFIPKGLKEFPAPLIHESAYYWAAVLVTGNPDGDQDPPAKMGERHQYEAKPNWLLILLAAILVGLGVSMVVGLGVSMVLDLIFR